MNNPVDVFVTESNVDIYLTRAYSSRNAKERDLLLRLVANEEARMGASREHMENGARRIEDCKERVKRQRELAHSLQPKDDRRRAVFMLETFERTLVLIEGHQRLLVERFQKTRL
jgi:hypothetical protein